jgi:hypothetical protein
VLTAVAPSRDLFQPAAQRVDLDAIEAKAANGIDLLL